MWITLGSLSSQYTLTQVIAMGLGICEFHMDIWIELYTIWRGDVDRDRKLYNFKALGPVDFCLHCVRTK